jgi:cold shock protein
LRKNFSTSRDSGFIQPDDGGKDVFVHISAVERAGLSHLNEGQKISFEVMADRKTGKTSAASRWRLRAKRGPPLMN